MKRSDIKTNPADYPKLITTQISSSIVLWGKEVKGNQTLAYIANKEIVLLRDLLELSEELEKQNLPVTELTSILKKNRGRKAIKTGDLFTQNN